MFVVTGTPRSATGYASLLFGALGIPCTHERVFRPRANLHEVLEWSAKGGERGESSWLAWAFLPVMTKPVHVLHTVRNPWRVIESLAHHNDIVPTEAEVSNGKLQFRQVCEWYCPRIKEYKSAIDRAAAMVVEWNHHIELTAQLRGAPYKRYQVESLNAALVADILQWLGIYRDEVEIERALNDTPRNVNGGRRLLYNVEIKNEALKSLLEELNPGIPPVLSRVSVHAEKRPIAEIEQDISPELRDSVRELAQHYDYEDTQ